MAARLLLRSCILLSRPATVTTRSRSLFSSWSANSQRTRYVRFGDRTERRRAYRLPRLFGRWTRTQVLLGGSGVVLGGWWIVLLAYREPAPITGRKRSILMSREKQMRVGAQNYAEMLSAPGTNLLPVSHPAVQMVHRVATRIIKANGLNNEKYDWKFTVVDAPDVANACVLPGGKVIVYSGVLPIAASEEGLAALLGHEIGHDLAGELVSGVHIGNIEHMGERMTRVPFMFAIDFLAYLFLGFHVDGLLYFITQKFSREQELEADELGMTLMARACYDPVEAVGLFQRMKQYTSKSEGLSKYWSTHPATSDRIKHLQSKLHEAQDAMALAGCKNVSDRYKSWMSRE